MINITFPDGSVRAFSSGVSALDIAESISTSLKKNTIAAQINGSRIIDAYLPLTESCELKIITPESKEGLEIIRHDAAHLLAQAVKDLYKDKVQVTIGPVIENGFYYDFAISNPFSESDLALIEKKMEEISSKKLDIRRQVLQRNKAIEYFKKIGENFKALIIAKIPENEEVSLYSQGDFTDLCRGPHSPSTFFCKHFKLLKVSSAYWEGNSQNQSLQRIYGTAWSTKKDLENYLTLLEEAEKRDHRKLGKELSLFHISESAVGSVFWHERGFFIYSTIQEYIRKTLSKNGYFEVKTPFLMNKELWEKSGHWDKYKENMFVFEDDKSSMALKPMSCPAHIEIFKNSGTKSYRDLPLRMAEFGCCHRNESSGSLHGIMRVRSFTQDDAHIFCTEEQVKSETKAFCDMLMSVYKDFGFSEVEIKLSTRPDVRAGTDEIWDKAEKFLEMAVKEAGYNFELNPKEGAFYGPKLEFQLKDAIGRMWQCGTLQLDFVLPERLEAFYVDEKGEKKHPIILHRAIIGTLERFIGILIESYAGKMPLWLCHTQVAVCVVTNEFDNYALQVQKQLADAGIRCITDLEPEKINYKIRKYMNAKIPFVAVVGRQEAELQTVSIRQIDQNENISMSIAEFIQKYNFTKA